MSEKQVVTEQPVDFWVEAAKAIEAGLGRGAFFKDPLGHGGMIVKGKQLLAFVARVSRKPATIAISFRASLPPNTTAITTAIIAAQLAAFGFKIELDPVFEFGQDGDMLAGTHAVRHFAENAQLILLDEKPASQDSTKVRPKGPYTKHNFN